MRRAKRGVVGRRLIQVASLGPFATFVLEMLTGNSSVKCHTVTTFRTNKVGIQTLLRPENSGVYDFASAQAFCVTHYCCRSIMRSIQSSALKFWNRLSLCDLGTTQRFIASFDITSVALVKLPLSIIPALR